MVNKQYIIQSHKKLNKNYSPPPSRVIQSTEIVSTAPNPTKTLSTFLVNNSDHPSLTGNKNLNIDLNINSISEENNLSSNYVYGQDIQFRNENFDVNACEILDYNNRMDTIEPHLENQQQLKINKSKPNSNLTINDIGRFQYILQMDREMGSHVTDGSQYRLSSATPVRPYHCSPSPSSSTTNSLTSSNRFTFWKAGGSQIPINTTSTPNTHRNRRKQYLKYLRAIWKYTKWPFALLIVCGIVGILVYFLVLENELSEKINHQTESNGLFHNPQNAINFEIIETTNNLQHSNGHGGGRSEIIEIYDKIPVISENSRDDIERLSILVKNPISQDIDFVPSIDTEETTASVEATTMKNNSQTERAMIDHPTTVNIFRNTQIVDISKSGKYGKVLVEPIEMEKQNDSKLLFPTKETLKFFGFTSGHQNNFGIPIEEDERILRILNEQLMNDQQNGSDSELYRTTTDSDAFRTKVSPTLPDLRNYEPTTERFRINSSDEVSCRSTSLPLCRGVLPYDLTTSKTRNLTFLEMEHFKYLIDSKCSHRTKEFICSVLEPECRPKRMGILEPCKRICKSILEPCAHIIAASEVLTITFDCDSYQDSNDPNVCKDVTRYSKCFPNEFKCADSSCIPLQWRCDNIRDCTNAEDEENCTFCEEDEFRCHGTDKCIPDKWRCDQYDDCPEASDELDCFEDDSKTFPPAYGNTRVYPYVQEQHPNSPTSRPYLTISGDDRINSSEKLNNSDYTDDYYETGDDAPNSTDGSGDQNTTNKQEDEDDFHEAASGIVVPYSKSLANFQDSKEIMMTSDSEADYKFSSSNNVPLKTAANISPCPEGELRCVSGRCITLSQLCDKVTDCPDGADEAMCV